MLLTTQHKNYDPNWCRHVVILPGYIEDWKRFQGRLPITKSLLWGWKLFRLSGQFQVVVTGSERLAFVFAGLQKFRRHKVPHIFVQSMWDLPHTRVRRWIKRTLLRGVASSAARVVVYSRRQLEIYPRQLGLPPEKFVFLYSHTSLYNEEYAVSRGDYVFSGGDSNRDYATLIGAARNLPCRVVIVSHQLAGWKRSALPGNVEVIAGLSANEFNRMMAGAALVVVPLRAGTLETGGAPFTEMRCPWVKQLSWPTTMRAITSPMNMTDCWCLPGRIGAPSCDSSGARGRSVSRLPGTKCEANRQGLCAGDFFRRCFFASRPVRGNEDACLHGIEAAGGEHGFLSN